MKFILQACFLVSVVLAVTAKPIHAPAAARTYDLSLSADLGQAAERGDTHTVRSLLEKGADPNTKGRSDSPIIFSFIARGDIAAIRLLLDHGADPNVSAPKGTTPLMVLFVMPHYGQREIARMLLAAGAQVNAKNHAGKSASDFAIASGQVDAVRLLIELGATVDTTIALDVELLDSARKGMAQNVQGLLAKGADPNSKTFRGHTKYRVDPPLVSATQAGHKTIVEMLLKGGADPNNQAPLFIAIRQGDRDIVELLLKHGANVNMKQIGNDWTPLMFAVSPYTRRRIDIIRLLISAGAELDAKNSDGHTAALMAAEAGFEEIARILIDAGAKVDQKHLLDLLLIHAALRGDINTVQDLLAKGAEANAQGLSYRGQPGPTPLGAAVAGSRSEVVKILLEAGAKTNLPGAQGQTPLFSAAGIGNAEIVKLLLEQGGDPKIRDSEGRTPLMEAVGAQTKDPQQMLAVVKMLIAAGADVNAQDRQGKNVVSFAVSAGRKEGLQLLRKSGARVGDQTVAFQQAVDGGTPEQVEALISIGVDVEGKYKDGDRPLIRAAQGGRASIVKVLLDGGANANARDKEGFTPLYHAAYSGRPDIIKLLLARGADVNAKINGEPLVSQLARKILVIRRSLRAGGGSASTVAISAGHASESVDDAMRRDAYAMRLLLEHGANPNVTDKDGLTPLIHAAGRGRLPLVQTLLAYGADVNAKGAYAITAWQVAAGDEVIEVLNQARKKPRTHK